MLSNNIKAFEGRPGQRCLSFLFFTFLTLQLIGNSSSAEYVENSKCGSSCSGNTKACVSEEVVGCKKGTKCEPKLKCVEISTLTCRADLLCPGKGYQCKQKAGSKKGDESTCVSEEEPVVADSNTNKADLCHPPEANSIVVEENCDEKSALVEKGCAVAGSPTVETDATSKKCKFQSTNCYVPEKHTICGPEEDAITLLSGVRVCHQKKESNVAETKKKEGSSAKKSYTFFNPVNCSATRNILDSGDCQSQLKESNLKVSGSLISCTFLSLNCYKNTNCPKDKQIGPNLCLQ